MMTSCTVARDRRVWWTCLALVIMGRMVTTTVVTDRACWTWDLVTGDMMDTGHRITRDLAWQHLELQIFLHILETLWWDLFSLDMIHDISRNKVSSIYIPQQAQLNPFIYIFKLTWRVMLGCDVYWHYICHHKSVIVKTIIIPGHAMKLFLCLINRLTKHRKLQ